MKHRVDITTAIEVILYITKQCTNMYHVLKIIYFADKAHLAQYGQLMYHDTYLALSHGPVPSAAYDLVKYARGDGIWNPGLRLDVGFAVKKHHLLPYREPNMDYLSESAVECLDAAILKYGKLSFDQLKQISHDEAYQASDENDFIPLASIIRTLPDSQILLDYVSAH